jgi:hypothetical protein
MAVIVVMQGDEKFVMGKETKGQATIATYDSYDVA